MKKPIIGSWLLRIIISNPVDCKNLVSTIRSKDRKTFRLSDKTIGIINNVEKRRIKNER